ncbi:MAG: ABC transporter ATP-binding protein, partial [Synergistaceae bacterium]
MITFSNLTCGYGKKPVLNNISGQIEEGKLTSLIGPNGSGKSTFIRAIAGFGHYAGNLKIRGREANSIKRRDFGKIIGIVPQQTDIASSFSVYEIIELGRLPYRDLVSGTSAEDEKIIVGAAERTGISNLLCRCASELSGGEKQRVLFSMVLAQNPDIFLLDEPTSALDPNQSVRIFSILRELADAG